MADTPLLPVHLLDAGERCGELLRGRSETVAVAEGSCGGLITAALLAVPGASSFVIGGGVIYTRKAYAGLLGAAGDAIERPAKLRGATEPWALHLARSARVALDATWGIGEGGATGPTGNPYGDPAGHAWLAVSGPTETTRHLLTGNDDRVANMVAFAVAGLTLLAEQLG
jgi:nicotinamide-nucleotide amidase